jgi:hypothetical protein
MKQNYMSIRSHCENICNAYLKYKKCNVYIMWSLQRSGRQHEMRISSSSSCSNNRSNSSCSSSNSSNRMWWLMTLLPLLPRSQAVITGTYMCVHMRHCLAVIINALALLKTDEVERTTWPCFPLKIVFKETIATIFKPWSDSEISPL